MKKTNLGTHITSARSRATIFQQAVAVLLLFSFTNYNTMALAQVVAAPGSGPNAPQVDTTANNRPLVQIVQPNSAGLSHNKYQQFDVDERGVILNNSIGNVQTQQGGWIQGNPNLNAGAPARIILNEVQGGGRTRLNGFTEIAGSRAEVIIANPDGINCNGCGFINASRGVLTTGAPVIDTNGNLGSFRVVGGDIAIGSNGLNAANIDRLDLLTRAVSINGEIWAKDLNVVSGTNLVNYSTLGVTFIDGVGDRPTVGVDVAQLGGMYANKIYMVGTEAGVGVNSSGVIAAQNGDFQLSSQGRITLSGTTTASGDITLSSSGAIANSGTVLARQVVLSGDSLTNSGPQAVIAGSQGVNLWVDKDLINIDQAVIYSLGDINIAKNGDLDANGHLANQMASLTNSSATIEAGQDLRISAQQLTNKRTRMKVESSDALRSSVDVANESLGTGGGGNAQHRTYTKSFVTEYVSPDTTTASQILSGRDMWLKGDAISNDYSIISAGRDLQYEAQILKQTSRDILETENRNGTQYLDTAHTHRSCRRWVGIKISCRDVTDWSVDPSAYSDATTYSIDTTALKSSITAGRTLTGTAGTLINVATGRDASEFSALGGNKPAITPSPYALPANGLYHLQTAPGQQYLVETDSRFTDKRSFLSSEYLLSRLSTNGSNTLQRLGDGFYEQKLVSDQITALSGFRYLQGYANAKDQFKALMDNALSVMADFHLEPGLALTPEQIARLQQDIVWIEKTTVTLPDGSKRDVLSPHVYLSTINRRDVGRGGALIAAQEVRLTTADEGNSFINSGTIGGASLTQLASAGNVQNLGGTIGSQTSKTQILAGQDVVNYSGSITGDTVKVVAGRDIVNERHVAITKHGDNTNSKIGAVASISATNDLTLFAGQNYTQRGAEVKAGGNVGIGAKGDIKLDTVQVKEGWDTRFGHTMETTNLASSIAAGGNTVLQAGNNAILIGASLSSTGITSLGAGKDVLISAAKDVRDESYDYGSLSYSKYDETVKGSTVSGNAGVNIAAGSNLILRAARVASTAGSTNLAAKNAISVETVDESHTSTFHKEERSSGLFSKTSKTIDDSSSQTYARGSHISGQNVDMQATAIGIQGSDLAATHDLNLTADQVQIIAGVNAYKKTHNEFERKSGLLTGGRRIFPGIGQQIKSLREDAEGWIQSSAMSHLSAENINVNSKTLKLMASQLEAKNNINLVADRIDVLAGQDATSYTREEIYRDKNFIPTGRELEGKSPGYKSFDTTQDVTKKVVGSRLTGSDISLLARKEDITLQASQIKAQDLDLDAEQGAVNLTTSESTAMHSQSHKGSDIVWQKQKGQGDVIGDTVYNNMEVANLNIKTKKINVEGTAADIKKEAALLASQPGMEWLNKLKDDQRVDWKQVEQTLQHWDYDRQGLTTVGAIIVVIVVTYLTSGWGSGLATTATAETTTAATTATVATTTTTASTIGGATLSTTTVAAGSTAVTYTALGAALNAGFSSLMSQAAVSLVNNKGDVGKTLSDMGDEQTVKSVLASMATAGVGKYFTPGLKSVVANSATACATAEFTGSDCKKGAALAAILAALEWSADAMRKDTLKNSEAGATIKFEDDDSQLSNTSGESSGVNGDGKKLAGVRLKVKDVCQVITRICDLDKKEILDKYINKETREIIVPKGIMGDNSLMTADKFAEKYAELNNFDGTLGGLQGGPGSFFGIKYNPGSFIDKLLESFSGPHDTLNKPHYYQTSDPYVGWTLPGEKITEFWNYFDIIPATPFAAAAFNSEFYFLNNIRNGLAENRKDQDRK